MSNILVIDYEMGVRESLHVFLTSEGHTIDTVANGREALNLIQNKIYDLFLTDMMMPEMDVLTLLKEIRDKFKERTSFNIMTADSNISKGGLGRQRNGHGIYRETL